MQLFLDEEAVAVDENTKCTLNEVLLYITDNVNKKNRDLGIVIVDGSQLSEEQLDQPLLSFQNVQIFSTDATNKKSPFDTLIEPLKSIISAQKNFCDNILAPKDGYKGLLAEGEQLLIRCKKFLEHLSVLNKLFSNDKNETEKQILEYIDKIYNSMMFLLEKFADQIKKKDFGSLYESCCMIKEIIEPFYEELVT